MLAGRLQHIIFITIGTIIGIQSSLATNKQDIVSLNIAPSHALIRAGVQHTVYLKIGLTGFARKGHSRPAANVAIVLDKSGSMTKDGKIERAKEAAIMALDRLNNDDYASVIAYSGTVEIIHPSKEVTNKPIIASAIRSIFPSGSTALFAGVSKGADQVRTHFDKNQINRVILLSDGKANVGPQTPRELGMLGRSLRKEGITVTTIGLGLGYNEDIMAILARNSGGNHAFAENANDLAKIFQYEFSDFLSVVAQNAQIRIVCQPGIKPISVLGHRASISGHTINVNINQVYNKQEKYIIVELQVPPTFPNQRVNLVTVNASYNNMQRKQMSSVTKAVVISSTANNDIATLSVDKKVMSAAIEFIAIQRNERAIELRDQGRIDEARTAFIANEKWLRANAKKYGSKALSKFADVQADSAKNLSGTAWNRTRKMLKNDLYRRETQQSY